MKCPSCDSNNIETIHYKDFLDMKSNFEGLHDPIEISLTQNTCNDCGEWGDFCCLNNVVVNHALKQFYKEELRLLEDAKTLNHIARLVVNIFRIPSHLKLYRQMRRIDKEISKLKKKGLRWLSC